MKMPSRCEQRRWTEALTSADWEWTDFATCPDPKTLWAAACGHLDRRSMRGMVDHVARCAVCAHDLRAARQTAAEVGDIDPPASWWERIADRIRRGSKNGDPVANGLLQPFPARLGWSGGQGGAWMTSPSRALAVAVVGLALVVISIPPRTSPWPAPTQLRGQTVESLLEDDQPLRRDLFILEWRAIEGALYDVQLMSDDFDPIVAIDGLTEPRLHVAGKDLADLEAGTFLHWRVAAQLPGGTLIRSSAQRVCLSEEQRRCAQP